MRSGSIFPLGAGAHAPARDSGGAGTVPEGSSAIHPNDRMARAERTFESNSPPDRLADPARASVRPRGPARDDPLGSNCRAVFPFAVP